MKQLRPIKTENNIAIVFSTNKYFIPYMAVMIQSVMNCASLENFYDIIVLHSEISSGQEKELVEMGKKFHNCSIRLYDVSEIIEECSFFTGIDDNRLSQEAYYRLMIGDILSSEYEKAVYLDGDMVTLVDIAKLYDEDITDYYLAAVPDICGIAECYMPKSSRREYREEVLNLTDPDSYFISGLLVLNLVELRKAFPSKKLLEIATTYNWQQHDQDVLNLICNNGKAKMLHASWNVLQDYGANHLLPEPLLSQWYESEKKPFIVHYGGSGKPWEKTTPREEYFWKTAAQTEYFETIINRITLQWTQSGKPYQPYTRGEISALAEAISAGEVLPQRTRILKALKEKREPSYEEMAYKPLISIIVPVYKTEKYLPEALDSLIAQSYKNLEIILVDDGSPDNSGAICDLYAEKDCRIKVIHKENGGVGSARNVGLAAATGEWIGWMDSDDWLEFDMYEYMAAYIQDQVTDIVCCGRIDEYIGNSVFKGVGHLGVMDTEAALIKLFEDNEVRSYLWDKLFRKELLAGIVFPETHILEDYRVIHKIFERAKKIVFLSDEKYHYRQRQDSLVNQWNLPQTMELLCAEGERLCDVCYDWPQILWILSIKYTGRIQGIWRDCNQLSRQDLQRITPLLRRISDFTRNHYALIMTDTYLGLIGKIQIWLTRFPQKWSFALHGMLDKIHHLTH